MTARRLAFNTWLTEPQRVGRLDPVGALARDVLSDSCWPTLARTALEDLEKHLRQHRAPKGVLAALAEAHDEWRRGRGCCVR